MIISTNFGTIVKNSFIFAFLVSGAYFIFNGIIKASVTGAVIGANESSFSILLGVALFVVTLVLVYHKDKAYQDATKEFRRH